MYKYLSGCMYIHMYCMYSTNICVIVSQSFYWFRYSYARDFPFINVYSAFITLFELLTLEGWTEVRDMLADRGQTTDVVSCLCVYIISGLNFSSCKQM